MKRYKAYFFDLYGTLVDIHTDEESLHHMVNTADWYSRHGAPYAPKAVREEYLLADREDRERVKKQWKTQNKVCKYPESDIGNVFRKLYEMKGVSPTAKLIEETAWEFRKSSTTHLRLYAGAKELLAALREQGSKVYLLSNAQALFTMPELRLLGIADLFDDIHISSQIGAMKPDPLFYGYALKKHSLDPADCLMVGNDLRCDILGAANAGMDGYYIYSKLSPKDDWELLEKNRSLDTLAGFQKGMDLHLLRKRLTYA